MKSKQSFAAGAPKVQTAGEDAVAIQEGVEIDLCGTTCRMREGHEPTSGEGWSHKN